jgi:hypothetical protein
LRTLFEIGSYQDAGSEPLLVELGADYCVLAKMDPESQQPLFARVWTFEATQIQESLKKIIDHLQSGGVSSNGAQVSLAFPETVILPESFSGKAEVLLNALYPGNLGEPRMYVDGKQYAFLVPPVAITELGQLGKLRFVPAHACMPPAEAEGNSIHTYFIDNHFRVAVYKGLQLQLVQQYSFVSPLDVVYYLLKICTEFGLSQQDTLLSVSGFITAGSALYKELHQYFLNIRFAILETFLIDGQEVPKHYFSSLYNLSACASSAAH